MNKTPLKLLNDRLTNTNERNIFEDLVANYSCIESVPSDEIPRGFEYEELKTIGKCLHERFNQTKEIPPTRQQINYQGFLFAKRVSKDHGTYDDMWKDRVARDFVPKCIWTANTDVEKSAASASVKRKVTAAGVKTPEMYHVVDFGEQAPNTDVETSTTSTASVKREATAAGVEHPFVEQAPNNTDVETSTTSASVKGKATAAGVEHPEMVDVRQAVKRKATAAGVEHPEMVDLAEQTVGLAITTLRKKPNSKKVSQLVSITKGYQILINSIEDMEVVIPTEELNSKMEQEKHKFPSPSVDTPRKAETWTSPTITRYQLRILERGNQDGTVTIWLETIQSVRLSWGIELYTNKEIGWIMLEQFYMYGYERLHNQMKIGQIALALCVQWALSRGHSFKGFKIELSREDVRLDCEITAFLEGVGFVDKGDDMFVFMVYK